MFKRPTEETKGKGRARCKKDARRTGASGVAGVCRGWHRGWRAPWILEEVPRGHIRAGGRGGPSAPGSPGSRMAPLVKNKYVMGP